MLILETSCDPWHILTKVLLGLGCAGCLPEGVILGSLNLAPFSEITLDSRPDDVHGNVSSSDCVCCMF